MANRAVVYKAPGKVAVEKIPDPKFETPNGRKITHAAYAAFDSGVPNKFVIDPHGLIAKQN